MRDELRAEDYAPLTQAEIDRGISWSPADGFTALQTLMGRTAATLQSVVRQRDAAIAERDEARRVARDLACKQENVTEASQAALAYPEVPHD